MVEENEQISLLESMAQNEEKIRELYNQYSLKFPGYSDFWSKIANEEHIHASWLQAFKNDVLSGKSHIANNRFNRNVVDEFTKYIISKIEESKEKKVLLLSQALVIALDVERSLIEKDFFSVVKSDSEDLKNILTNLYNETKEHIKRVEDLQNQINLI